MELFNQLVDLASYPIPHAVMISLLKGYKRPNDKIHELISGKVIIPVRKGLYVTGPAIGNTKPSLILLANHIMGPSYVSMDFALSYYGLIPEKVFEISSMTIKTTRKFENTFGVFTYTHAPLPYYSYGISLSFLPGFDEANKHFALIASAEKALCDKIIYTRGLTLRGKQDVYRFLFEDIRIDSELLQNLNTIEIESWLDKAPKKSSLNFLLKALRTL